MLSITIKYKMQYKDYFLPLNDVNKQKRLFNKLLNICFDFYSGKTRNFKFLKYKTPEELRKIVDLRKKEFGQEIWF